MLYGYSLLISYLEEMKKEGYTDEDAAKHAIMRCMDQGILKDFLQIHRTEVTGMLFDYVSKEEFAEIRAEEKYEEGVKEGIKEGIKQGLEKGALQKQLEIAKAMKDKGMDINMISEFTDLSLDQIKNL